MPKIALQIDQQTKKLYEDFEREAIPHKDALFNFALKLTGGEDEADDLVQETYLKAFRFFDKFELGTNCKAWLFSIMKNTFINEYRKVSKEPNKVDYEDVQNFYENIKADEVQTNHLVSDSFSNVFDDEITDAIAELPSDFQTIIILADIEGYSYEEIAEFMSCPIGTVRSRLHRARKLMFTKLHDYAENIGYVMAE
ncbi:MAG: sigma-70 family RNA polymerase sigma factor [Melioribacteraceae bacterium]|nr:sigma-70 family RNA polymerase sigma factor [Melioribacteraceae bacterium]